MPNYAISAALKENWWKDKDDKEIKNENKKKVEEAFSTLKKLNTIDPFDEIYLAALTTLRDTLLN